MTARKMLDLALDRIAVPVFAMCIVLPTIVLWGLLAMRDDRRRGRRC